MSHEQHYTTAGAHSTPSTPGDDWSGVSDPNERRRIQNRIAQRKFREKARQQRRLEEQLEENAMRAGASYTSPNPDELDMNYISGPPWGSISLKHVLASGREKQHAAAHQTSVMSSQQTNEPSRPGLHLIENYARREPAWMTWRIPRAIVKSTSSIDTDGSSLEERQGLRPWQVRVASLGVDHICAHSPPPAQGPHPTEAQSRKETPACFLTQYKSARSDMLLPFISQKSMPFDRQTPSASSYNFAGLSISAYNPMVLTRSQRAAARAASQSMPPMQQHTLSDDEEDGLGEESDDDDEAEDETEEEVPAPAEVGRNRLANTMSAARTAYFGAIMPIVWLEAYLEPVSSPRSMQLVVMADLVHVNLAGVNETRLKACSTALINNADWTDAVHQHLRNHLSATRTNFGSADDVIDTAGRLRRWFDAMQNVKDTLEMFEWGRPSALLFAEEMVRAWEFIVQADDDIRRHSVQPDYARQTPAQNNLYLNIIGTYGGDVTCAIVLYYFMRGQQSRRLSSRIRAFVALMRAKPGSQSLAAAFERISR